MGGGGCAADLYGPSSGLGVDAGCPSASPKFPFASYTHLQVAIVQMRTNSPEFLATLKSKFRLKKDIFFPASALTSTSHFDCVLTSSSLESQLLKQCPFPPQFLPHICLSKLPM